MFERTPSDFLEFRDNEPPQLIVTIDTEAEFEWGAPFSRSATCVDSVSEQHRAQDIFDKYDIIPTYLVDFAVANNEDAVRTLRDLHETVSAQAETFIRERPAEGQGIMPVERPDTVFVAGQMENGATAAFLFSGVARYGSGPVIEAYGSEGTLVYKLSDDTILGARAGDEKLALIPILEEEEKHWTVEQDFIDAIRTGSPAATTFEEGVQYMEFTEAVTRSAQTGQAVSLPL